MNLDTYNRNYQKRITEEKKEWYNYKLWEIFTHLNIYCTSVPEEGKVSDRKKKDIRMNNVQFSKYDKNDKFVDPRRSINPKHKKHKLYQGKSYNTAQNQW